MNWKTVLKLESPKWSDPIADRCLKRTREYFDNQLTALYEDYTGKPYIEERQVFDEMLEDNGFIGFLNILKRRLSTPLAPSIVRAAPQRKMYIDGLKKVVNNTLELWENCNEMEGGRLR